MEREMTTEELLKEHEKMHAQLRALHKRYGTSKRQSDDLLIGSFLVAHGVRLPKGLITKHKHSRFSRLMRTLHQKSYLQGRLWEHRRAHPEKFPTREERVGVKNE